MRACFLGRRLVIPYTEVVRVQPPLCTSAGISPLSLYRQGYLRSNSPRNLNRTISAQSRPRSPNFNQPRQASSIWTITVALAAICGGLVVKDIYSKSGNVVEVVQPSLPPPHQIQDILGVVDTLKMTTDQIPPGHVGNLTEEQEKKLQEFWLLVLKVFGVKLEEPLGSVASPSPPASPSQEEKKKQPKRRFGFFSRGGEDEDTNGADTASIASGISNIKITDGDDKYGQHKEFQQALSDHAAEDLRVAFWSMVKQDNPDSLLLRFLRARKWDVHKALIMLISTMRWRLKDARVDDDVMRNGEEHAINQERSSDPAAKKFGEEFMKQVRMGKSFLHGVDRNGRPICYVRVRYHKAADQSPEVIERYTVYLIETARILLAPPIETAAIIFDMTDFTIANMDYLPVKFMVKCFEANYPESLGVVMIHKAPWIFSGIWRIIKGWLDPVVASKINFTNTLEDLEQFIPRERIIKELGGDEEWEYSYVEPISGENTKLEEISIRDEMLAKRHQLYNDHQTSTLTWISAHSAGNKDAIAAERAKRDEIIRQMREGYWELDPYLRARSLYDRIGVILGGGKLQYYPNEEITAKNGESSTQVTNGQKVTNEDVQTNGVEQTNGDAIKI